MTALTFEQDHTQIILSQLRHNLKSPLKNQQTYLQLNYMHHHIVKLNPEEAEHHEKSIEEENLRDYID